MTDLPNELVVSYAPATLDKAWAWSPLLLCGLSLAWLAGAGGLIWWTMGYWGFETGLPFALAAVPHIVFGLGLMSFGLFLPLGRITVRMTRDELQCRWSLGGLGFSSKLPVGALLPFFAIQGRRSIRQHRGSFDPSQRKQSSTQDSGTTEPPCLFRSGEKPLMVSLFHNASMRQRLFALLVTRLKDWGIDLWRVEPDLDEGLLSEVSNGAHIARARRQ